MVSARTKEPEIPREGNQRGCIKCHRLLPGSAFMKDPLGNLTAWCDVCRDEAANNWSVDREMVEWVHAFYLYEKFLAKEAETVTLARVNMGLAKPADMDALRGRIGAQHMLRHSRIPERLRRLLVEYRENWYAGIRMDVPDLSVIFPPGKHAT